MAKRRRKWHAVWIGGALVLLWFGWSDGWFRSDVPSSSDDMNDRTQATPAKPPAAPGGGSVDEESSPAAEPGDGDDPPAATVDNDSQLVELDRVVGLLRQAQDASSNGNFDAAWEALRRADTIATVPSIREQLDAVRGTVTERLVTRLASARASVADGAVLEAAAALRPLAACEDEGVRTAIRDAVSDEEWPHLEGAVAAEVPANPGRLDPGSPVRVLYEGAILDATVAGSATGRVNVKLTREGRVYYPVVDRVAVEPRSPTVDIACDQCAVAIEAGDRLTAVLWWAVARRLDAANPRVVELRGMLDPR